MTTIHAKVSRTDCYLKVDGSLTSGMVGIPVTFEFGSEWDGLKKTAVFRAGAVTRDRIDIECNTTVPAEVLEKPGDCLYVGVYGYREDGTIVIPTVMAMAGVILRGANPSGDPGADPNLPIWAELEQRVSDLEEGSGDAAVKSVNGITPDENGNVEIKIPESSGSSVTIDPTLTQSGQAADAKAVGDAIANLDIPSIEGLATEEYVNEAIANIDIPSGGTANDELELIHNLTITEEVSSIEINTDLDDQPFILKDIGIKLHLPSNISKGLSINFTDINGKTLPLAYIGTLNRDTQYLRKFYSNEFVISMFGSAADAFSESNWQGYKNATSAKATKIILELGATDTVFPINTKVELWGVRA